MLTSLRDHEMVRDERAPYRPFRLTVQSVSTLTPHFTRVTFTGEQLEFFGTDALDQRIKIVFPLPALGAGLGYGDFGIDDPRVALDGSWHSRLRALPVEHRNPFRTYTVRGIRPAERELDIDFVMHPVAIGETTGPAAAWVSRVAVGDPIVIVGPDARSVHSAIGIDWHPGDARSVLLAGDETAAPAICAILESLPASVSAQAFIEVPAEADRLPLTRNGDSVTWLTRVDPVVGSALEPAVRAWVASHPAALAPALAASPEQLDELDVDVDVLWDSPESEPRAFYAWIAGESAAIKSIRRFLVTETGIDRHDVAFMGYWRAGRAERQE